MAAVVATAALGSREGLHRVTGGGAAAGGSTSSSSSLRSHAGGTSSAAAPAGITVPEGFVASSFFAEQPFFSESPPPSPEQETATGGAGAAASLDGQQPLLQLFRDLTRRDWLERMSEVDIYERDLHRLILNFFTVHGYEEAAEAFSKEAGMEPEMPVESIARRSHIKQAVLHGRMEEAIHLINLVDRKILPSNPEIDFLLKQQQLLHLIKEIPYNVNGSGGLLQTPKKAAPKDRGGVPFSADARHGDTCAAIDFAQQQLAPCVKQHPDLLPKLEEAMALLAFNDLKCAEAQHLLGGMDQREQTARRIDEAILDFFNVEQESALETLTKNVIWTQKQIQKRHPGACPIISDVGTGMMISPTATEKASGISSSSGAVGAQQQQDTGTRVERRTVRRSGSRRLPHVEEAEGDSNGSEEEGGRAAAGGSSGSAAAGGAAGPSVAGGGASGGPAGGGGSSSSSSSTGEPTTAGTPSGAGRGGTAAATGNPAAHLGSGAAGGGRPGNRPVIRSGPPSVLSSRRTYHSERGRRDIDRRRRDAS